MNRQNGIFKKANHLHKFYPGVRVGVVIIHKDGTTTGYQSCPGLIRGISSLKFNSKDISGPDEFDTVADRRSDSPSVEESEKYSQDVSSPSVSAGSRCPSTPFTVSPCAHSAHSPESTMSEPHPSVLVLGGSLSRSCLTKDDGALVESRVAGNEDGIKSRAKDLALPSTGIIMPKVLPEQCRDQLMLLAEQLKWQ